MRATRAYLAGFGTSGSLLAGAALMFLLASAFVAFQGWPAVAGQSSPVAVSIPRLNAAAGSRDARVLAAVGGSRPGAAGARVSGAAGGARPGSLSARRVHGHRSTGSTQVLPVSTDPGAGTSPGGTTSPTQPTTCSGCGGGTASGVVGAVKKTVSSTTSAAGSSVANAVSTVKKLIPKSVGDTVSEGGTTVGKVVKTTTNVVSGVTGGLP